MPKVCLLRSGEHTEHACFIQQSAFFFALLVDNKDFFISVTAQKYPTSVARPTTDPDWATAVRFWEEGVGRIWFSVEENPLTHQKYPRGT